MYRNTRLAIWVIFAILTSGALGSMPICGITGYLRNTSIHTDSQAVSSIEECITLCQHHRSSHCESLGYVEFEKIGGITGECSMYERSVEDNVRATSNSTILFFDVDCFDEIWGRNEEKSVSSSTSSATKLAQVATGSFPSDSIYSALPIGSGNPMVSPSPEPISPFDPFVTKSLDEGDSVPFPATVFAMVSTTGTVERLEVKGTGVVGRQTMTRVERM